MQARLYKQLNNIDLNTENGRQIKDTKEYIAIDSDIDLIEEAIYILDNGSLIDKKNFFIDNQSSITEDLRCMHNLYNLIQDNMDENTEQNIIQLSQFISNIINKLESGIDKFSKELTSQVSNSTKKEDVCVTEQTIAEAMNSNQNTIQMAKDLQNPNNATADDQTSKIQNSFNDFINQKQEALYNQKNNISQQFPKQSVKYIITSLDLQEVRFVQQKCDKATLNNILQNCGIDNARVFELREIPTKRKAIQKIVTTIG